MTIHALLTEIGLSNKEATVYMTLLRSGTQSTSYIAKRSNLNRGTAYVVLHTLLQKGLVVQITKRKIQYFTALDPMQLPTYIDRRERDLAHQKTQLQTMMGQLLAIKNPHTNQPKIQYYEGQEGARTVLEDTLTAKTKILRSYLSIADMADFLGQEYFQSYTSRRVTKGYTLHAIRTPEKDREALMHEAASARYRTSRKERREVRHAPDLLTFPITLYIYDHKIALISSKNEGYAVLIESEELADMQQKLFSILWISLPKS